MSAFVHMELSTDDPVAAQKFYEALFQWKFQEWKMEDGTVYLGFSPPGGPGAGPGGGIQKKPMPDQPTAWLPYVGVPSVKRAMAKAAKLGAQPIVPFMKVGEAGALGIFRDPTGAMFAVWESAQKAAAPPPAEEAAKSDKKAKKAKKAEKAAAKKTRKAAKDAGEKASVSKAAKKAAGKKAAKKRG